MEIVELDKLMKKLDYELKEPTIKLNEDDTYFLENIRDQMDILNFLIYKGFLGNLVEIKSKVVELILFSILRGNDELLEHSKSALNAILNKLEEEQK